MALSLQRDVDELRDGLEQWLGRPIGRLTRPDPGWSCETLIVDDELVVRLPPLGEGIFPAYDLAQQAAVQGAAGACGVPVAAPIRHEPDPAYLGAEFLVMPFVPGPIPGEFTAGDPWLTGLSDDRDRRQVWDATVTTICDIHGVDRDRIDRLGLRQGLDAELVWWGDYLEWACDGDAPVRLVDALAWCAANRPAEEPEGALLWGDVRFGNIVFDAVTLRPKAVLDWDMASIGPAELDLAWFLALEALQVDLTGMSVAGFGDRAEAAGTIEGRLGRRLVDLDWFEVFALVRASAISTRIAVLFNRAGERTRFSIDRDPTLAAAEARIEARITDGARSRP